MKNLMKKPDSGISVSLPDDSNVFLWKANIVAPRGSLYEGNYNIDLAYKHSCKILTITCTGVKYNMW